MAPLQPMIAQLKWTMVFGSVLIGLASATPPGEARPFFYMSSFDYSGPYTQCATRAEKALRANGFNRDLESKEYADQKFAAVYAYKDDEAITAEIQCVQKAGITLLGVAGLDNESTWESYQALRKAEW